MKNHMLIGQPGQCDEWTITPDDTDDHDDENLVYYAKFYSSCWKSFSIAKQIPIGSFQKRAILCDNQSVLVDSYFKTVVNAIASSL
ncbi:hypothetical protein DERF_009128 [Dermatophagoides farinae]|uniref:Uncharacterized protein n=1 Tax=Dermatophagoides farinae TaxID=6954 RepID=A0A922L151_DERFA|nr:hypothetical protein DERF_009128 [Dermatophagoides farinae]